MHRIEYEIADEYPTVKVEENRCIDLDMCQDIYIVINGNEYKIDKNKLERFIKEVLL